MYRIEGEQKNAVAKTMLTVWKNTFKIFEDVGVFKKSFRQEKIIEMKG